MGAIKCCFEGHYMNVDMMVASLFSTTETDTLTKEKFHTARSPSLGYELLLFLLERPLVKHLKLSHETKRPAVLIVNEQKDHQTRTRTHQRPNAVQR